MFGTSARKTKWPSYPGSWPLVEVFVLVINVRNSFVLSGEAESVLNTMEEVTEQLLDEKKLMKKLQMDEEELKQKINRLQTELDGIKVKQENCQERCQGLEHQYNEEKERLSMIEDTVQRIGKSKERVKMMVHNFAPALNLEDYD